MVTSSRGRRGADTSLIKKEYKGTGAEGGWETLRREIERFAFREGDCLQLTLLRNKKTASLRGNNAIKGYPRGINANQGMGTGGKRGGRPTRWRQACLRSIRRFSAIDQRQGRVNTPLRVLAPFSR